MPGKIVKLVASVGQSVNAGDVLCIFDSTDLQQQYDTLSKNQTNSENQTANQHKINERNLESAKKDKEINLQQAQRAIDDEIEAQNEAYNKEAKLVDELNAQISRRDDAKNKMDTPQGGVQFCWRRERDSSRLRARAGRGQRPHCGLC